MMTRDEIYRLLATPGRANYSPLWLELAKVYEAMGDTVSRDAAKCLATENKYYDWPSVRFCGVQMALAREKRILAAIMRGH